jgi:hypothetical protein
MLSYRTIIALHRCHRFLGESRSDLSLRTLYDLTLAVDDDLRLGPNTEGGPQDRIMPDITGTEMMLRGKMKRMLRSITVGEVPAENTEKVLNVIEDASRGGQAAARRRPSRAPHGGEAGGERVILAGEWETVMRARRAKKFTAVRAAVTGVPGYSRC